MAGDLEEIMGIKQQIKDWNEFKTKVEAGTPESSPLSGGLYDNAMKALGEAYEVIEFYGNDTCWNPTWGDGVTLNTNIFIGEAKADAGKKAREWMEKYDNPE